MSQDPNDGGGHVSDSELRVAELERLVAEQQARIVAAELKAEAIRAGMIDLDGLKMVEPGAVRLTDTGKLEGAAEAMRALRRSKPYLFGVANSSHPAAAPSAQPAQARKATQMSHSEWQAARAELLRLR